MLEMVKMAIHTHDSEQADNIMKQIMSFSYEEDIQAKLEHLNTNVINLDPEGALADIGELQT